MRHYETKTTVDRWLAKITCSSCEVERDHPVDGWTVIFVQQRSDDVVIDLCPKCSSSLLPNLASFMPSTP